MKNSYDIYDIDCASCALKIEKNLKATKGVKNASVDFAKSKVIIESDEALDLGYINELAKKIEPDVYIKYPDDYNHLEHHVFDYKFIFWIVGIFILIVNVILDHTLDMNQNIYLLLMIVSYLFISYRILFRALKNVIKGQVFDEHILMTIATLGALMLGEYIEGIAVMVFYQIGEYFQDVAVNRSRKNIKALLELKPSVAHKMIDGKSLDINPDMLSVDDIIMIKAGEIVPVDAILVSGDSTFDYSLMTGESLPVDGKIDMNLPAGVMNLSKPVYARVSKIFKNSSLQKMMDFVESNSMKKAKAEKFMSKFSRYYTPIVVGAALLLAFIVPFFYQMIEEISYMNALNIFVERALIFLVISCPCALVLSIPLSFYAGIGLSSKKGILVKSGSDLEMIEQIEHFVFDKTGTLTKGSFSVTDIKGDDPKKVLKIAALLEAHSTHPIGKSILEAYDQDINNDDLDDVEEIFGQGLTGIYQGCSVAVGNQKLIDKLGLIHVFDPVDALQVFVVYKDEVIGYIRLEDQIKPDVLPFIKKLKEMGKDISLVTGDKESVAHKISKQLGIEHVYAEVSPEDKVVIVQNLKTYEKVAFLGDGVNDAMVLMTADLGISMGSLGSDAAIEASDAVIMNDDPKLLLDAIKVSKYTKRNVIQNIWMALGIKGIVLILGALGLANMWLAVFADVGVSLIAVLNAMRLLRLK